MGVAELTKLLVENGFSAVLLSVLIVMVLRQSSKTDIRFDQLLSRVVHGDGNGAPSLAKIQQAQERLTERVDGIDTRLADGDRRMQALSDDLHVVQTSLDVASRTASRLSEVKGQS